MQHLFSPVGEAALATTLSRRPLLAFDFDGTLAPIVTRPADARISKAVATRLAALADRLPLAIVTGRSVDDVRGRLEFEPRFIVGNHGAEQDGVVVGAPALAAMADLRNRLHAAQQALSLAGVSVEDKDHSIALHYRLSRARERALQVIAELLQDMAPELRVFGGKLVVNVAPRQAPDKAAAVRRLQAMSDAPCVLFAGDDVNDEPVFEAATADWLTIRVGRDNAESRAMYFLDSPGDVALLLDKMLAALRTSS